MSTILKALKRLEEDRSSAPSGDSAATTGSTSTDRGSARHSATTDPSAPDPLRERILAEEAAASISAPRNPDRPPLFAAFARQKIAFATAGVLFLAVGLIGYSLSGENVAAPSFEPSQASPLDSIAVVPPPASAPAEAHANSTPHRRTPAALSADPSSTSESDAPPASQPAASPALGVGTSIALSDQGGSGSGPVPIQSAANAVPTPSSLHSPSPPTRFAPPRASSPNPPEIPLAAVTPTRSVASAEPLAMQGATQPIERSEQVATHTPFAARPSAPPRPRPSLTERAPAVVSARATDPITEPGQLRVAAGPSTRMPPPTRTPKPMPTSTSTSTARPTATRDTAPRPTSLASDNPVDVQLIDHRGLPDVSVIRTSWHPRSDQRSVRLRLEASNEIVNLHEGDAIGGLVVKEISPSSVIFASGDIEIRRRVGQSDGG